MSTVPTNSVAINMPVPAPVTSRTTHAPDTCHLVILAVCSFVVLLLTFGFIVMMTLGSLCLNTEAGHGDVPSYCNNLTYGATIALVVVGTIGTWCCCCVAKIKIDNSSNSQ